MHKILNNRILRDFKTNFFRYLALFLLITLGMYMIVSIVGAAENIITGVGKTSEKNKVEDGEFTVFVPLSSADTQKLKEKGITLEEAFYMDYSGKNSSTLRIYKNRKEMNLLALDEGNPAKKEDEIVLEKHYAQRNQISLGDTVLLGGKEFKVTGIGSTPDYDAPFKNMSDSVIESSIFGLGFVTDKAYEELKEEGKFSRSEEYVYSYLLNGSMTGEELKDYLKQMKLDRDKVKDTYFLSMIADLEKPKKEIQEGIGALSKGAGALDGGLGELDQNSNVLLNSMDKLFNGFLMQAQEELTAYGITLVLTQENYGTLLKQTAEKMAPLYPEGEKKLEGIRTELNSIKAYREALNQYTLGVKKAKEGSKDIVNGTDTLEKKAEKLMEDYFTIDIDNLTQFTERKDNPRIAASVDDVKINKTAGMIAGVIILILFTYVISVFVIHGIEQESTVIGALYALGVTKRQLLLHYLLLPVIITFLGGSVGTILGFSPLGVGYQTLDTVNYFSLPRIVTVYPLYLVLYGILLPPLTAVFVNYLVINKILSQPALKLLRREKKQSRISNVNLGNLRFIQRFQIRQFLRELRTSMTVVFGMFIALLILMMGIDCYVLCINISTGNRKDTAYEYMYSYKYPEKEPPKGGEACYGETLNKTVLGYDLDITLLGIDDQNKYFKFHPAAGENKITISQAVATKFNLSEGEKLVLSDEAAGRDYAFTIDRIVPYSVGLYAFMNIKSMRKLFDREEDYYNLVLSDTPLTIDSGRLYGVTTRGDICKSADVFKNNMMPLIISMTVVSVLIFVMVMYLMMKVMIDRSSYSIALMKIFGFQRREIKKLYLDGNFLLVALGGAVCIPVAKAVMDALYPYLISNVACGMDLRFSLPLYAGIYLGIIGCYLVINRFLVRRIEGMAPAELLKDRE